jgi:opacity protein-like surface antigen
MALAGLASAQTQHAADTPGSYIGVGVHSAFGNVTSQAFGFEGGTSLTPSIGIFVEGGKVVDAAPASLGQSAQLIASYLSTTQANVGYSVAEPVLFFDAGARYTIHTSGKLAPYALAGLGLGQVKPDVEFTIGGTNVNSTLSQYGVALGSDLSGSTTKIMVVVGAGVRYPLGDLFYADAEFRYNRVFISGGDIPFSRLGLGFGVRF